MATAALSEIFCGQPEQMSDSLLDFFNRVLAQLWVIHTTR
jgi:hypothetical protein